MTRPTLALRILLPVMGIAVLVVLVVHWPASGGRAQEVCVKDAIFCVQRVSRAVTEADNYEAMLRVEQTLRLEAGRLDALRQEYEALPPASRWERSRVRKHRQLAETTLEAWSALEADFRERLAGDVPPHVRPGLIDALDVFARARAEAWAAMMTFPD
jgi:hypothetical protein